MFIVCVKCCARAGVRHSNVKHARFVFGVWMACAGIVHSFIKHQYPVTETNIWIEYNARAGVKHRFIEQVPLISIGNVLRNEIACAGFIHRIIKHYLLDMVVPKKIFIDVMWI